MLRTPDPRPSDTVAPRRRVLLLVVLLVAFRVASWVNQLLTAAIFSLVGAPGLSIGLVFGGLSSAVSPHWTGAGAVVASLAVIFAAVPLAGLVLGIVASGRVDTRPLGALALLLFAMATLAEMLCETLVFATLGKFNGGIARHAGVPLPLLMILGVSAVGALSPLVVRATEHVMSLHTHEAAPGTSSARLLVAFKFTVGVAVLSTVRLALG